MAETMYVRCPNCNTEQPSMIQMDRESFKSATLEGNTQECANCRKSVLVENDTVYFK